MVACDAASLAVAVAVALALAAHVGLACRHEEVEDVQILVAVVREEAAFDEKQLETDSSWKAEAADLIRLMVEKTSEQVNGVRVYLEEGCLVQPEAYHRL